MGKKIKRSYRGISVLLALLLVFSSVELPVRAAEISVSGEAAETGYADAGGWDTAESLPESEITELSPVYWSGIDYIRRYEIEIDFTSVMISWGDWAPNPAPDHYNVYLYLGGAGAGSPLKMWRVERPICDMDFDYEPNTTYSFWAQLCNEDESVKSNMPGIPAKFTIPDAYTITYELNGGTNNENNQDYLMVSKDKKQPVLLWAPHKAGYFFDGWYWDAGFNEKVKENTLNVWKRHEALNVDELKNLEPHDVTGDVTVYAKWTNYVPSSSYWYIYFDGNGSTAGSMSKQKISFSQNSVKLDKNAYTRDGYIFCYWNTRPDGSGTSYYDEETVGHLISGDGETLPLYAIWMEVSKGIHYELNGGTNNKSNPLYFSDSITEFDLADPVRVGYQFEGWYTDSSFTEASKVTRLTKADHDGMTIYAKWSPYTYTVVYDKNSIDATGGMGSTSLTYGGTGTLAKNTYTRTDYALEGWSLSPDGTGCIIPDQTDQPSFENYLTTVSNGATITLYAVWKKVGNCKVIYVLNEGVNHSDNPAAFVPDEDEEKLPKLQDPTRVGYRFLGWYSDPGFSNKVISFKWITKDITLYAKWQRNFYKIKFDNNEGAGRMDEITPVYYDQVIELPLNTFSKSEFGFVGWNTQKDGNGTSYENGQKVSNLTLENDVYVYLYAMWKQGKYRIRYVLNGGTNAADNPIEFADNSSDVTLKDPTRTGYKFLGWDMSMSEGKEGELEKKVEVLTKEKTNSNSTRKQIIKDATIYAKWTAITYPVVYNGNGSTSGSMDNSTMTYDESAVLSKNTYERTGYTFAGWSLLPSHGIVQYLDQEEVQNLADTEDGITLYAQWTPNQGTDPDPDPEPVIYNIQYVLNGGTNADNPAVYVVGSGPLTLKAPTREGYTFDGWYTEADFAAGSKVEKVSGLTKNITLYAKWLPKTYHISYELNGGTNTGNPATYEQGSGLVALKDPARTGYNFEGWFTDRSFTESSRRTSLENITSDITLYAKWTPITYTIVYDGNGNTGGSMENSVMTYGQTAQLTMNAYTRNGYGFVKWNTQADGKGTSYENKQEVKNLAAENNAQVKLYAIWQEGKYRIWYELNGGKNAADNPTEYNAGGNPTINLQDATRTGYIFGGWYAKEDFAADSKIEKISGLTDNITLYAKWTPITYTIVYDGNGSTSGSMGNSNSTMTYDVPAKLSPNGFHKTLEGGNEYTFAGWNTQADGKGTFYADQVQVENLTTTNGEQITFYAIWVTGKEVAITYELNGGTNDNANPAKTYTDLAIELRNPTKTGYKFDGWYRDENFAGVKVEKLENLAVDVTSITLYAKWSPITYTIVYIGNGSTSGSMSNSTMTYGVAQNLTENAYARSGYQFVGWNTQADGSGDYYENGKEVLNLAEEDGAQVKLYAIWTQQEPITYTVVYDGNGSTSGSMSDSVMTYDVAQKLTTNAYSRTGYIFIGWNLSADGSGKSYTDGEEVKNLTEKSGERITLYAQWQAETPETPEQPTAYTVTFQVAGPGGKPEPIRVNAGEKIGKPSVSKVIGYYLKGWYKDQTCTEEWDFANDTVTMDITLYARWVEDANTVTQEDVDDSSDNVEDRTDLNSINAKIGAIKAKVYDGSAYMPTVKVTATVDGKNIVLAEGADYRVLYENNVNAGTGSVIVKGNGAYKGTISAPLTISKKPVGKLKVVVGNMGLNSQEKPPVYVFDGTELLVEGTDYTLSGTDQQMSASAGKKPVTISATERGNYTGTRSVKVTVSPIDKVIQEDDVSLEYPDTAYTGKAQKPVVKVRCGGVDLDAKSYTVKYINNKDVGTAYVLVTGKKEYAGSVLKSFKITIVAKEFKLKKSLADTTFNGKVQKPKVTVTVDGRTLKAGKDYVLFYNKNFHASTGTGQAAVIVKGRGGYAALQAGTFHFKIRAQKISKAAVKGTKDQLILTFAGRTLMEGKDYKVIDRKESDGKLEVTIEGMGDFEGSVTKKLKVT